MTFQRHRVDFRSLEEQGGYDATFRFGAASCPLENVSFIRSGMMESRRGLEFRRGAEYALPNG